MSAERSAARSPHPTLYASFAPVFDPEPVEALHGLNKVPGSFGEADVGSRHTRPG